MMVGRLAARSFWGCTKKHTFTNSCHLMWDWLQECGANYMNCSACPSIEMNLPVRLIEISQSLGDTSMRLISFSELDSPRYVALSHC